MKPKYSIAKTVFALALLFTGSTLFGQKEFAFAAPKGICVTLGKWIPNGVKTRVITVERKEAKGGSYQKIAEVISPTTEADFIAKATDAKKYFPDFAFPNEKQLKGIWARARYGTLDSLNYLGHHQAVEMALGTLYYDLTAKEKTAYVYKVSIAGSANEVSESASVTFPFQPKFDEPRLETYTLNKDGMYLRFRSTGKNPCSEYKVFRYGDSKTAQEMNGTHGQYTVKDTTFYVLQDKNVTPGKTYQYSIVGVDKFGNTAQGSQLAVVSAVNFGTIYFAKTEAKKATGRLGIKLVWKLNDTRDVKSIHIFRSKDALRGFEEISAVRASDTSYIDDKITPDKIVYYYLEAKDETGKLSKKSSTFFEYGLETQKPLTPSIIAANEIPQGVKLRCAVPDKNLAGYRVYRADASDNQFACISDLIPTRDSALVTFIDSAQSLSGKVIYNYYIQTENTSHLQSNISNKMQCRAGLPTEPSAPVTFSAYYQDGGVNLYWSDLMKDDFTVAGYTIFRKEEGAKDFKALMDTIYPGNQFKDTKLDDGKDYEYQVQTNSRFGEKSKDKAIVRVSVPASKPIAPGGLRAANTKDGVVLEWGGTAETNVKNYMVYRYQRAQNPVLLLSVDTKVQTYTDKTAKTGELYFYYLTSLDDKNRESGPSDEVGVRH